MPKRDSCSRNQLFHLEILSLPWTPFCYFFFFFSYDWFPDSLVLIQVSQRGENISLWVPVLCKSEPEYTPWDMSALRLVNSRLWKPLVCISPLIRETHTSSSRWASTLLGFPWKQGEWTDPLWADTKVSFYTNRIEICRWSVLVEANAKKQLAKKQTKKKIKQQSNWMRLRNKQKKTLEAQKCLHQCPLGDRNLCIGLTFENVWVSNMRRSDGDNWDREQKPRWLVWLGGLSKQEVL